MVKRSRIVAFFLIIVLFASLIGTTTDSIVHRIKLGLDLQGGFEVLYDVQPVNKGDKITDDTLASTAEALDRRINTLGVSEPRIDIEEGNRIRVQLAGIEDQEQAREMLSTTAVLSFRDANDNKLLDGTDLVEGGAKQSYDQNGKPNVTLKLKDASTFAEATSKVLTQDNPVMVIWLDFEEGVDSYAEESKKENPKYISAPGVSKVINSSDVEISGNFTPEEAQDLANLLNAGALPVELKEVYSTSVGAQFGADALQTTVTAGIIGVLAVFLFLLIFYRLPGFVAVVTLSIYIFLILAVYDGLNAVLTLPGIAALLLGIGMAVDANIITYERIKEELRVGRSLQAAFKEGNKSSFITILDANLTTMIAAVVLFFLGTSSVKGFATMLIVSVLVSFITAVYASRLFLQLLVKSNKFNDKLSWFGVKKDEVKHIREGYDTLDLTTKFDKVDFVKHKNKFFALSAVLIVVGLILIAIFRLNLAIDFSSGTRLEIMAEQSLTVQEVSDELQKFNIETEDIVVSGDNDERAVARFKDVLDQDEVNEMKVYFHETYGSDPNISVVTPTVGKELVKNAIYALAIASVGIILYVSLRFEMRMAVAAIIALLHDVFFMIAIFSITRFEVDLNFVAAILTIIGYSVNDTIVTFDRIRDHMKRKKRIKEYSELVEIVNKSLRQVFTRSINTALTTLLPVLFLLLMGSEAIWNFSFAMTIGLIIGVYSSLYIAAQLWLIWKGKELKKKGVLTTYKEKKKYNTDDAVL
ncbi:protein translocase subunit SecDF [Caldibacillus lycopersici]|uniref:Multifunctional fusion protein n=1 Tax=Perspicuibacillus lycopersici TaxID=1325689 RepID=A0AAE3IV81_9BACI|nr:protein translocase subunit SecDF [Perspicuibacillus lycopersici]MCU9613986.1 protein translocase subunit SecDF [Perspicuibacillus lycopersici]